MIKALNCIFFLIILNSCSFHDSGGFWSKEKKLSQNEIKFVPVFKTENIVSKEFNSKIKISLKKENLKVNKNHYFDNNDGYNLFDGNLKKIKKYSFSKIKNFYRFEPNLIFHNKNIIFSIIKVQF